MSNKIENKKVFCTAPIIFNPAKINDTHIPELC